MKSKKKFESQIVDLVDRLPSMPKNIDSLLRSAGEDRQHEEELIELAEQDPVLCADLLHQANTIESSHRHWTKKRGRSKESWFEKAEKSKNISLTTAEYLIENHLTRYEYDVQS